jgi:hypothetical protein
LLRIAEGRQEMPTAAVFDSRTMQSTPESGGRSGYDGAKRRKGSKVHLAVDTLRHLLALSVTAADEQDRAQVSELAKRVQEETGETVEIAYVDLATELKLRGQTLYHFLQQQAFSLVFDSANLITA